MITLAFALLLASFPDAGARQASTAAAQTAETYTVECTFSHPSYSGRCTVTEETASSLTPRTACERILGCLNDSRCSTKTYCNATTIRGGWRLETAGKKPRK